MLGVGQSLRRYCHLQRYTNGMSPTAPDVFSSSVDPDILEAFKALCGQQRKQHAQVLEQLMSLYLESKGSVLDGTSVPSLAETVGASSSITTRGTYAEMLERLERVETDNREFVSAFEILIHRVDALEGQVVCKELEKRLDHLEKAVQYRESKSEN